MSGSLQELHDLIPFTRVAVKFGGCPLCGGHHELVFHSYPWRWTVGSDGERSHIRVVTILCKVSRAAGRPYTKRILPEYLIPRSPFRSERLVKLVGEEQDDSSGLTDLACEALGCIDPRTARKHLCYVRAACDAKLPVLAGFLAAAPGQAEGPAFPPGTNRFVILSLLWKRFHITVREFSGFLAAASLTPFLWLGPGFETWQQFNRSCIPIVESPQ